MSSSKLTLNKAILLGKEWMKESVNSVHNYEHAKNTCAHAEKIYAEYVASGRIDPRQIPLELVQTTSWWHDAFKSRVKGEGLYDLLFEGMLTNQVIRKELGEILTREEIRLITRAVRRHTITPVVTRFFTWDIFSPFDNCLLEADALEILIPERLAKHTFGRGIKHTIEHIWRITMKTTLKHYLKTEYSKKELEKIVVRSLDHSQTLNI